MYFAARIVSLVQELAFLSAVYRASGPHSGAFDLNQVERFEDA